MALKRKEIPTALLATPKKVEKAVKRIEHPPRETHQRLAMHSRTTSETTSKTFPPADLLLRIGKNLDKYDIRLNMPDKFLNMLALL